MLNAGVEVNEALVQYQTAREKADYYDKQVASLQTAAKSTSLLMKHGNTTYLEVLTAQQTLLNAQLSQVANRFTEIQGVITLYQALGGGRMEGGMFKMDGIRYIDEHLEPDNLNVCV